MQQRIAQGRWEIVVIRAAVAVSKWSMTTTEGRTTRDVVLAYVVMQQELIGWSVKARYGRRTSRTWHLTRTGADRALCVAEQHAETYARMGARRDR